MKSIVVGYIDAAGRTAPKIICGPEVPDGEQAALFLEAKRQESFPDGCDRLEWAFVDASQIHIAIRIGAAGGAEGGRKAKATRPKS